MRRKTGVFVLFEPALSLPLPCALFLTRTRLPRQSALTASSAMRWGVALSLALLVLFVSQCAALNFKTRSATSIAYSNITQVPFWIPFDASNFTASQFRTGLLRPLDTTMMIDLFDFKFNIPASSLIRGIAFRMEQCSTDVTFPW